MTQNSDIVLFVTGKTQGVDAPKKSMPISLLILLVLLLLAPLVTLSFTPWHANSSLWFLGMLPVIIGLFSNARLGFGAAVTTPVLMGISLLLRDQPVPGALYMAAVALATGIVATRGWHKMMSFAAPLAAFALIGDLHVTTPSGTVDAAASLTSGLFVVGFVLVGGLWTATIGSFLVRAFHMKPASHLPLHTSIFFSAALGVLVGVGTYVAMEWLDGDSWWMLLTLYVVVQPYYSDLFRRVAARVVGTLAGALVASIIVILLKDFPPAITAIALLLTVGAMVANLKLPYWVFVTFLTPAVVLQTEGGADAIDESILHRAVYTIIGSVAAVLVLTIGHLVVKRFEPAGLKSTTHDD